MLLEGLAPLADEPAEGREERLGSASAPCWRSAAASRRCAAAGVTAAAAAELVDDIDRASRPLGSGSARARRRRGGCRKRGEAARRPHGATRALRRAPALALRRPGLQLPGFVSVGRTPP